VTKICESFDDGFARIRRTPDRQELSVLAVLEIAEVHGKAEVWGRFGQESRSFGQQRHRHARYAKCAKPHKHCLFRILLIWRVGT
jgi:hypothetical protein